MSDVERQRERLVRKVACPVCGAGKGHECDYPRYLRKDGKLGGQSSGRAHTGRYNAAAELGLVPPLPGDHAASRVVGLVHDAPVVSHG
jgi:hypothetical protein